MKRNNERNGQFVARCVELDQQGFNRKGISEVCVTEFGITQSEKDPTGDHSFRAWFARMKPYHVELQAISAKWHHGKTTVKMKVVKQELPVLGEAGVQAPVS